MCLKFSRRSMLTISGVSMGSKHFRHFCTFNDPHEPGDLRFLKLGGFS